MKRLSDPITNPKFKKLFDIPREYYEKSLFLRNIKEAYIRFGSLSELQISTFKKAVEDFKHPKPQADVVEEPIEITTNLYSRPKRRIKMPIKTPIKTPAKN